MFWVWLGLSILGSLLFLFAAAMVLLYVHLTRHYLWFLIRCFKERPLFIIPRGQPLPGAEDISFPTSDGLTLRGCYLHHRSGRRSGVIVFGLEFGSNRWSCVDYCKFLLENGFDVFAFESRGQGQSDPHPDYEPLQWVTDYEVRDVHAALDYLRSRKDADPRGVGFFGISKGGSAGLLAAADDAYVRCFVTDGIFATRTTMVPYMRKWIAIASNKHFLQKTVPLWYYSLYARRALYLMAREKGRRYPHLESALPRLGPRPLLMIHGGGDTYIKPEMAQRLFKLARGPKELWLVDKAKHNQALQVAGAEYRRRVLAFFETHLAGHTAKPSTRVPAPHFGKRSTTTASAAAHKAVAKISGLLFLPFWLLSFPLWLLTKATSR